jgi:NADH-quinone oxidoreductase subunit C|tara:strand:- start:879 stop:1535 length:657 start_codon:yes stop_codon:yes gene_type:complete
VDNQTLISCLKDKLTGFDIEYSESNESVTIEVNKTNLVDICKILKSESSLSFNMLIDICAIDYLSYGDADWKTLDATNTGFSRAVKKTIIPDPDEHYDEKRFGVFYQLLSIDHNVRLSISTFTGSDNPPTIDSVNGVWNSANWFEREAFDLMGIQFKGHPDLRRILTDYGFIGHPFRKDFPTNGNLEVVYDEEQEKVVYKPVSITTRPGVPRIIRKDK